MNQLTLALGYLGMTKRDVFKAIIGTVGRRLAIQSFNHAASFESPVAEFKRFLQDPKYRKMLIGVGGKFEPFVLGSGSFTWKDLMKSVVTDHSPALRGLFEEVEDNPSFKVNDETMEALLGEVVGKFLTKDRDGPVDEQEMFMAPEPTAAYARSVLNEVVDRFDASVIFPDIHEHLTRV